MSETTRDEQRQLQDRFLAIATVRHFVAENGENEPLWFNGPNARQVQDLLYPALAYAFRDAIEEYGD